jgi:X-X-X-Leu-X-X-Gly heptad repeat protein
MKQTRRINRTVSDWRSVRMWESNVARDLRQRRMLWLHGLCIGLITLVITWGVSALQMRLGVESLALRYLVSLGVGYIAYLLIVRVWAATLLRRSRMDASDPGSPDVSGLDMPDLPDGLDKPGLPTMQSGGGGDFGGGGASGDFADGISSAVDGAGDLAGGAIEAAAGSDEAAIVVVPVVAVFLIGCAILFGAGALTLLYFGWEVLLAVAVELAFSYATARTAARVTREGWASAAVRLTWKPLAGAVVCAVALGAAIDFFLPAAQSLPEAVKMVKVFGNGANQ